MCYDLAYSVSASLEVSLGMSPAAAAPLQIRALRHQHRLPVARVAQVARPRAHQLYQVAAYQPTIKLVWADVN